MATTIRRRWVATLSLVGAAVLVAGVTVAATYRNGPPARLSMTAGNVVGVTCTGPSVSWVQSGSTGGTLTCATGPPPTTTTTRPPPTTTTTPATTTTTTVGGGGGTVFTAPSTLKADCSAEVSAGLLSWIASVPDGTPAAPNTFQLTAGGCYRVDQPFQLYGRSNLIFDGNGATLRRMAEIVNPCCAEGYDHFGWFQSANVTVENLHILGTNTVSNNPTGYDPAGFGGCFDCTAANQAESGLQFDTDTNVTLINDSTDATWGDGLTFGGEHGAQRVDGIKATNVTVDRNGRQGVTLDAVSNALFDNVKILHSQAAGYDMEPNGTADSFDVNIEIRYGYVNSHTVAYSAGGIWDVSAVNIHDNLVKWSLPSRPWVVDQPASGSAPRRDWKVIHNTLDPGAASQSEGMDFAYTANVTVTDNVAPVAWNANQFIQKYPGVFLTWGDSGSMVVSRNDFNGAGCNLAGGSNLWGCGANASTGFTGNGVVTYQSSYAVAVCGNIVGDPAAPVKDQLTAC